MEKRHSRRISENKKRKINELYIDVDTEFDDYSFRNTSTREDASKLQNKKHINTFILTLYSICNDVENQNIVSFYDKGGIIIKDLTLFTKIIQNVYRINDYTSFVRNLNNYGFVNITPRHRYDKRFFTNLNQYNVNEIIYANPYFLNNKNDLERLCAIKCNFIHLHSNTFMKEIKELHNQETNEIIHLLLNLKNSKNI
jgi:hypothetical protein